MRKEEKLRTLKTIGMWGALIGYAGVVCAKEGAKSLLGMQKSEFEVNGKTIYRPGRFRTRQQKNAFQDVGRYVTDALTRNVMLAYQDSSLSNENSLSGRDKIPLDVWHEVLEFYRNQGVIEQRWELRIPRWRDYDGTIDASCHYAPSWDKDGKPLDEDRGKDTLRGFIPAEGSYTPGLLTDEQRESLIGVDYAMHRPKEGEEVQHRHSVTEQDFSRLFYRPSEVLTQESYEKGAKTLCDIVGKSE